MHTLSIDELDCVSGGGDVADAAQAGAAFGGAVGISGAWASGATGTAILGAAGIGAAIGAGLFASFAAGWAVGSWINGKITMLR